MGLTSPPVVVPQGARGKAGNGNGLKTKWK